MKIAKYSKVGKNKYKVFLENGESLLLYEEVILKFDLLLKKEIQDRKTILEYKQKYELYDKALGYLNKKVRSENELRKYLQNYTTDSSDIDNIINKLKENNYLDNKLYIKSYIHDKFYLSFDGPLKIKTDLINLGFLEFEIEDELDLFDKDLIQERIHKYINKQLKANKKSLYMFKNKMLLNLVNLGYERENILKELDKITLNEDSLREKEYQKLKKNLEKKYSGYELEQRIKRKLYEKGYRD